MRSGRNAKALLDDLAKPNGVSESLDLTKLSPSKGVY